MKPLFISLIFALYALIGFSKNDTIHVSEYLDIVPLTKNSYIHVSYLEFSKRIACNGLVFIKNDEAVVFDTPVHDEASNDLIRWIMVDKKAQIKQLVINHFHEDCLGGFLPFVGTGCASYAQKKTCRLAGLKGYNCAQFYFTDTLSFVTGGERISNYYPGKAHAPDNIVSYIESERVLFGGCMIKAIGSNKGNLHDADVEAWPETVEKVKARYPKAKWIVPGHGKPGKKALLDYTINLFSPN